MTEHPDFHSVTEASTEELYQSVELLMLEIANRAGATRIFTCYLDIHLVNPIDLPSGAVMITPRVSLSINNPRDFPDTLRDDLRTDLGQAALQFVEDHQETIFKTLNKIAKENPLT